MNASHVVQFIDCIVLLSEDQPAERCRWFYSQLLKGHPNQWSPIHSLFQVTPQSQHHSALHRGHCMCIQPPAGGDNTVLTNITHTPDTQYLYVFTK